MVGGTDRLVDTQRDTQTDQSLQTEKCSCPHRSRTVGMPSYLFHLRPNRVIWG